MKVLTRAVALVVALAVPLVGVPAAGAAEAPGVYDIVLNRGAFLPAGSMTATWRAVIPTGTSTDGSAHCHLSIGGVEKALVSCSSGQPFGYDLGSGINTATVTLEIDQFYSDPSDTMLLHAITGTTTANIDGMAPTASVEVFRLADDSSNAPNPMRPATNYKAPLVWNDNLAVTARACSIERISPAPTVIVNSVACGVGGSSHGGSALFTTPSTSGTYNFVLEVADPVGHTARAARPFVVDATPPAVTLTSGPADGGFTNAANLSWTWTSDDPAAVYACGAAAQGQAPVLTGCGPSYMVNGPVEGTYQLVVKATDTYANSATKTFTVTVDRTKPTVTLESPTGSSPIAPGNVEVVVQSSEPATYLCSTAPAAASPMYVACGSGVPGTSYSETYDASALGTHLLGVKAVDRAGNVSDPAVVIYTVQPRVEGAATLTGAVRVGSKIVAGGTWTPGTVRTYQWRRDGVMIPGATAATYVPTAVDLNRKLSVRVVGTLADHLPATVDSSAVKVAAGVLSSGRARVTGTPRVGRKLTASAPWSAGTTVRYQWYANGKKIAGASRAQLALTKKLAGKRLKVLISGSRAGYTPRTLTVVLPGKVRR